MFAILDSGIDLTQRLGVDVFRSTERTSRFMARYKSPTKKRFAVGAKVRVIMPGVTGVVTQLDGEPTVLGEYRHRIRTEVGEQDEPGSNLELIPRAITDSGPAGKVESGNNFDAPQLIGATVTQTFHLHGPNSRVNMNSTDNSLNVASVSNDKTFIQMREAAQSIQDELEREKILAQISELERSKGSTNFLSAYQTFISVVADHITVFAPFIPLLTQMLSGH